MGAKRLFIHPAFYRRVRHYRDRMEIKDGRPQVAKRFVKAAQELVNQLLQNPKRGHTARFEAQDLADILRVPVPGFPIFAVFYRWDGENLTIITLEHSAQDLPSRLAGILSNETGSYSE
jgi:plasmid stabilization system protein ParE